jgi:hypothetical protein
MVKVKLHVESATQEERQKLEAGAALLQKVLESPLFELAVKEHKYPSYTTIKTGWFRRKTLTTWEYGFTGGIGASTVLKAIKDGKEVTSVEIDNELDLHISMYSKWGKVVGHTTPWESLKIYVNRKFFGSNPVWDVASNMAHELTHQLGFYHVAEPTAYDPAYGIGKIVADIGERLSKP